MFQRLFRCAKTSVPVVRNVRSLHSNGYYYQGGHESCNAHSIALFAYNKAVEHFENGWYASAHAHCLSALGKNNEAGCVVPDTLTVSLENLEHAIKAAVKEEQGQAKP